MTQIDVFVKTPFNTYIKSVCEYDEEKHIVNIKDDNNLNNRVTKLDISLAIDCDIESFKTDIKEHPTTDIYDIEDIKLENIRIDGNYITCHYSVSAVEYRRMCVGMPSMALKGTNTNEYFLCWGNNYGKVCW